MNKPGCIIPAAQLSSRFRGPGPRCLRRASGADLRGAAVDRRGRPTLEEGNLWVRATMHAIVKRKKGDDRAATTFLSADDRPDGADVGNGSDPVG